MSTGSQQEADWRTKMDEASAAYDEAVRALQRAIDARQAACFAESSYYDSLGDQRAKMQAWKLGMWFRGVNAGAHVRKALDDSWRARVLGI